MDSAIVHRASAAGQGALQYTRCLSLALREGVALPHRAIELASQDVVSEFLSDWAERFPEQVVEGGVA
jgi:hypothetical protein